MLFNFCDPRLRPEIKCSSISTEGYEVTNLISDSCKGFLAYSCIKPPIHIDITFLCNIRINHILIWPSVGSQKSSGFQLYSRNTNDENTPYILLSNGYLSHCDAGLLFHPADIDVKEIPVPKNFLKRYIKRSMQYLSAYTHDLRITICKTENSVPALGKIEVWGTVSPRCGKDVVASVYTLWSKCQTILASSVTECKNSASSASITDNVTSNRRESTATFEIPEHFLDPITWEIMTQPITLPSGKIIDQTTLEKHEQNEAVWGRPVSDPFTGISFNEHRRPIMATALKLRIDKFLLENSNLDEIKNMPRVLGRASSSVVMRDRRIIEIPRGMLDKNPLKRTNEDAKLNAHKQIADNDSQRTKRYCHQLPAVVTCPKRTTANVYSMPRQVARNLIASSSANNSISRNNDNKPEVLPIDINISDNRVNLLSNIKRFNTSEKIELHNISDNCGCCSNSILYRLPCKHVICRKVLLSIENSQCNSCGLSYRSNDVERIHESFLSR
ncbi:PREDICTED: RING finger protein 37 [Dinoponera quadriceps]|uniref:RING finger protein 37 n=1 Tax=Dinoponera quadriceps TaxID=609295 RepID=A0A6P3WUF7_DINQU|nr:PREDICTED: RING finger protein 37 [Dinoponera quadriceps]